MKFKVENKLKNNEIHFLCYFFDEKMKEKIVR